jgi:uncharacterized membrane protein
VPDGSPRIVLLSDGNDPHRDGLVNVQRAAADGAQIDVVDLPDATIDARVTSLKMADTLRQGEKTRISAVIESTRAGAANLRLEEKGFLVGQREVVLKVGAQTVDFDITPNAKGPVPYSVAIQLPGDEIARNDRFSQIAWVAGTPLVLLVANTMEEGIHLEEALSAQDVNVESMSLGSLPSSLEGLLAYDEVILVGIPPSEIDRLRQGALISYVRDTGGGLLFVSGARGLRRDPERKRHPLEAILPLEMAAPGERQEPPAAVVLLIDRSGSMVGDKLSYAKQAAVAVIDRMTAHDQVGVIAFDAAFSWIAPLAPLEDKASIKRLIENLGSGGGTRFYPALEEAYFALRSADAAVRHAILLTDGQSLDPDIFPDLLARARQGAVTVSTVAIGHQADTNRLTEIAKLGAGRFTLATTAAQVPNIFVKEVETVQKDAASRTDTTVRVARTARELAGIDFGTAPPLRGYLRTKAKPNTEVLLETSRHDPLLARWRYGLGAVAAYASDTSAWSELWLTQHWAGFGKLWTQLARGLQRLRVRHDLVLTLDDRDGTLFINIDAIDAEGRFLNELEVDAVVEIEREARRVHLAQTGPGRYSASLPSPSGSVLAYPVAQRGGRRLDGDYVMLPRPYPAELAKIGRDEPALAEIARLGGGSRIARPTEVNTAPSRPLPHAIPLSAGLGLIALALFLGDVITRRARWERR